MLDWILSWFENPKGWLLWPNIIVWYAGLAGWASYTELRNESNFHKKYQAIYWQSLSELMLISLHKIYTILRYENNWNSLNGIQFELSAHIHQLTHRGRIKLSSGNEYQWHYSMKFWMECCRIVSLYAMKLIGCGAVRCGRMVLSWKLNPFYRWDCSPFSKIFHICGVCIRNFNRKQSYGCCTKCCAKFT